MILRRAAVGDAEAIATIWHSGWIDGHLGHVPETILPHRRLEDFRLRVPARSDEMTVAEIDGRVVGFVLVHEDEIEQIYVTAESRGSGVAATLIEHGTQLIGERHDRAWLSVVAGNARARRFYERSGWTDEGAFDYGAYTANGPVTLPCHRYETATHLD